MADVPDGLSPTFANLTLRSWRQFGSVEIEFHPRVTLLTGANASGKTTLLALLARHFNWPRQWVGLPIRRSDGTFAYFLFFDDVGGWNEIGSLEYGDGGTTPLQVPSSAPSSVAANYDVQLPRQQTVAGLYLTSHRSISSYTHVGTIPTTFGSAQQMMNSFTTELRNLHSGLTSRRSPFAHLKESLIAAAVFGEGSHSVVADPVARDIWEGFQKVLAAVLPTTLGFQRLVVQTPEVIVETSTGRFPLDESSGGMSALIELGWQIFLQSFDQASFVVLFDEPENHLHPELQRRVVPSLLAAFPNVQFVIATHSPFVVTSVSESSVYVLDYDDDRQVFSRLLDQANKAASADETLRRVLGLDTTMPLWAQERYSGIIGKYLTDGLTSSTMRQLRVELDEAGLAAEFPTALLEAIDRRSDDDTA